MPRPKFCLKTLLWLMAVVAAFSGGIEWDRRHAISERNYWRDEAHRMRDYQASQWRTIWKLHKVFEKHGIDRSEVSEIGDDTLFREDVSAQI